MKSIIIGAGSYGAVYLAYLQESNVDVIGFIDDNKDLVSTEVDGVKVLGTREDLLSLKEKYEIEAAYCPIGNNRLRVEILEYCQSIGFKTPNFIHSSVLISPKVVIGNGVYILPNTTIMPHVVIKDFVMISMGVKLAHHSILEVGTFLSTGVNFGASIISRTNAYVGIGSTVMTGVKSIGLNCLIGAGAVVIKDVPDNAVVAGVPARIIKYKCD